MFAASLFSLVLLLAAAPRLASASPGKLTAPDGAKYDYFGLHLDVFEDVLVSSSIQDDDFSGNTGSAYAFHMSPSGDEWVFDEKIALPNPMNSANFGSSVALGRGVSGEKEILLGVGASSYDYTGRAYIFAQSASTRLWSLQATLLSREERFLQYFGASGSLYGDTYAVGSYGDDEGASNSGSAYVYNRDASTLAWSQQEILTTTQSDTWMGRGLSLHELWLAVGADGYEVSAGENVGAVFLYQREGVHWSEQALLLASDGERSDMFGSAVTMNSDTLVVGAKSAFANGERSGAAYVFGSENGLVWSARAKLSPSNGQYNDWFGDGVALSSSHVIVTSPQTDVIASTTGSVYVFQREAIISWNYDFVGSVMAPDAAYQDMFGASVAIYGDVYVVGSVYDDDVGTNSGSVYTMNSTVIPTQMPSAEPSSQPTLIPSSAPSISFAPSLSTEAMIYFSVMQELSGVDAAVFADRSNVVRFHEAVAAAVPLLELRNVQFTRAVTAPSSSGEFFSPLMSFLPFVGASNKVTLVSYNVSYLVYSNGYLSPTAAYDAVSADIRNASMFGENSTLTQQLHLQGGPFATASVTDVLPSVLPFVSHSLSSVAPTSSPSQSPSCGTGSYISERDSNCLSCPPGTYSAQGGSLTCMDCSVGYYTDSSGSSACSKCPWPMTTVHEGWTECRAFSLDFTSHQAGLFAAAVLFVHFFCLSMSKDNKVTAAVIFTIPMLDISTDMLYIARSKFVSIPIFLASVSCTFIFPVLCFIAMLVNMRARPRVFGMRYLRPLLWLGCNEHGYPTVRGKEPPFFALRFAKHDSIVKIFALGIYWAILCTIQLICMCPVIVLVLLHSPLFIIWTIIGTFLYQIKVISIGNVWNIWFVVWSGGGDFNTDMDLKVKFYNKSLLAEFLLESLPQNFILWFNNTRTDVWSVTGYVSAALSMFMTADGIWRISYYKLYSGKSFEDIPVGYGIVKVDNRNSLNKKESADDAMLCEFTAGQRSDYNIEYSARNSPL